MPTVKPFRALRPDPALAKEVSCLPYDVMSTAEAADMAKGNPNSFLHIIRSEIDLSSSADPHSPQVYEKAKENLDSFIAKGVLKQEEAPCFYIYEETMNGRVQTGVCALTSIDDYKNGRIKKHEFTLPEKETDRVNNFLACLAHTEPVFFISRKNDEADSLIEETKKTNSPVYDFVSEDGVTHRLWAMREPDKIAALERIFSAMDALYIADGHHRTASSCRVGELLRKQNPDYTGDEEFNYIMAVIFSEESLQIMDYNRLLMDLGDYTPESFKKALSKNFAVKEMGREMWRTEEKHTFSMYLGGSWFALTAKEGSFPADDPVESLDAAILQKNVFEGLLGIEDPRSTKRLAFVGGIRGYEELKNRVDCGEAAAAFALYPVSISDLLNVADEGKVMPPKSTWFEPKLRSGLFIHLL